MEITCPSGLTGIIKGMTVGESQILTDRKRDRDGTIVSGILDQAWVETLDYGPYEFNDDKINWGFVLTGDRTYASMMARVATYGPDYDFDLGCQSCSAPIQWAVNLHDLPVHKYSEIALDQWRSNNRFETEINGAKVFFRLMNGNEEAKAQRSLRASKNKLLTALSVRIVEIEGHKNKTMWIKNLPMNDSRHLIELFDEYDGGVETNIEVICDTCGAVLEVELPFDRREFWIPIRSKKSRL